MDKLTGKDAFLAALFEQCRDRGWYDIDGGDFQDLAIKHGLLIETVATAEDIDEWAEYEIGEALFRFSPELMNLVTRARQEDKP